MQENTTTDLRGVLNLSEKIETDTRHILMDTFCLLNSERPVSKITVSQLAQKAGYDRTTFYQYFLDMEDIQCAVEEEFTDYIKSLRSEAALEDDSFIQTLVSAYEEKPLYFNALFGKYGDLDYLYHLTEAFQFDLPELHLADEDKQKGYLIEFHVTIAISLFRHWLQSDKDLPIDELMGLIRKLYTSGIDGALEK